MKKVSIVLLSSIFSTFLLACSSSLPTSANNTVQQEKLSKSQLDFFAKLDTLCGKTFTGKTAYPKGENDSFAGKRLVATIASCNDKIIRIPFHVGEDKSRTWLITKTAQGLLLKHDHRHEDGTPDEVTMYGGYATKQGNSKKQYFAADKHTGQLIPAATTNVWMIELGENTLTYYLERHNKPRYKAILSMQE